MNPPTLWGYDPSARYKYIPMQARTVKEGEKQLSFTLRAPSNRILESIDKHTNKLSKLARKVEPEAYQTIKKYAGMPLEKLSAEESAEVLDASEKLNEAFEIVSMDSSATDMMQTVFAFCVVGWENFTTITGVDLPYPTDKQEIVDMIPPNLALELYAQCRRGAYLSTEEQQNLK